MNVAKVFFVGLCEDSNQDVDKSISDVKQDFQHQNTCQSNSNVLLRKNISDEHHLCTNPHRDGERSPYEVLPHDNLQCSRCEALLCHNCRVVVSNGTHSHSYSQRECYKTLSCLKSMTLVCSSCLKFVTYDN